MIHDADIINVTKPGSVDHSLDDGVMVWITASSRFLVSMRRDEVNVPRLRHS